MKKKLLFLLLSVLTIGAWAQRTTTINDIKTYTGTDAFVKSTADGKIYARNNYNRYEEYGVSETVKFSSPDYVEVEYIESATENGNTNTTAPFIETGYGVKSNTRVVMECNITENDKVTFECLFGSRKGWQNEMFCLFSRFDGVNRRAVMLMGTRDIRNDNTIVYGQKQKINMASGNASFYKDGNTDPYLTLEGGEAPNNEHPLSIFNQGHDDPNCLSYYKLYSFKIYEGTTLVRDYVPVVKSDGKGGLRDKLSGTIVTSANDIDFDKSSTYASQKDAANKGVSTYLGKIVTNSVDNKTYVWNGVEWVEQVWNNPYLPSAKSGQQYAIRYTSNEMSHDDNSTWMKTDFNDASWTASDGPVGSSGYGVPAGTAALGTSINSPSGNYYIRRQFTLDRDLSDQTVYMTCGHDDEGAIWIDGTKIIEWGNTWNDKYVHTMTAEQTALLTKGSHVIAIWAKNNSGGFYWDCGLYGMDLSTNLAWGKDTSWAAKYKYAGTTDASDPANDVAGNNWTNTNYNDADWGTMAMPCGNAYPKDGKGTKWSGENNCYWFRRPFLLTSSKDIYKTYIIQYVHDDNCDLYINGKLLTSQTGWSDNYDTPKYAIVSAEDLRVGENVIAAKVKQLTGGSLFDCKMISGEEADVSFTPKAGNYAIGTYENLFDGNTATKWEVKANNGYSSVFEEDEGNVVFEASSAIYVNGLTLYTGDDTEAQWQRNPVEWILYGSNDEAAVTDASGETPDFSHSSWKVIARINKAQMPHLNETGKLFKFNPSQQSYKYFKFHVRQQDASIGWTDEVQLSRLVLDYSQIAKAPITQIANSGGNDGAGEIAENIFDGPSTTKWYHSSKTNWVVFQTAKPIYASSYTIQTANDSDGRDPKTFKLYGASGSTAPTTDGSTTGWTEIDSETDASATIPTDRYAIANFTIDNPGIYQFFMLKVEDTRSDGAFQLSEFIIDNSCAIITSDAEMADFATQVNGGNTTMNAYLLADVNSSISVGTETNKYAGTFDGQGHIVTLNISTETEYQGLIGCAKNGAVIKNVITRGSVSGSSRCGGILGGSNTDSTPSGTVTLINCGNEANVSVTGQNAGGIVGCNSNGSIAYILTNCYNTGNITGDSQSAGIAGWLKERAVVTNCYNIGNVTGVDGTKTFARWDNGSYNNCYNTLAANTFAGRTDNYPMEKVRSGELCVALGDAFTQDLSQAGHPTFGSKTVSAGQWFSNANDVYYNLEDGNYTVYQLNMSEANTKYAVPANVTAKNISISREWIADQWIGLCFPVSMFLPEGWIIRELTSVNGKGETASMMFSARDYITAGKPYLIKPNITGTFPMVANNVSVGVISATDAATASTNSPEDSGIRMIGNLNQIDISTGDFYINKSSQLKKLTAASATLKGFRAYFQITGGSGVKALSFDFDDEETSLSPLLTSPEEEGQIYNLAGQKLNKMQKGINIVNGKKVLK